MSAGRIEPGDTVRGASSTVLWQVVELWQPTNGELMARMAKLGEDGPSQSTFTSRPASSLVIVTNRVRDFEPGGYESPVDGRRGHFVCDALGYIDKTIDNVVDVPASPWRSDEVVTMLRELREFLVPGASS